MSRPSSSRSTGSIERRWRRDLFSSKRPKPHRISTDVESPSKYVAIACDSSDEDNLYPHHEEPSRIRRVSSIPKSTGFGKKKNCNTQFQIFSDDSDVDDDNQRRSELMLTSNSVGEQSGDTTTYEEEDDRIAEFTSPVKDSCIKDAESPVKTPVLKRHRERCDGDEIAEFVSPVSNAKAANMGSKIEISRRRRRRKTDSGRSSYLDYASSEAFVASSQSLLVVSDKSDEENELKRHPIKQTSVARRRKKVSEKAFPKFSYFVADAPSLSVVVLKTAYLDDSDGTAGNIVWALCYDILNECDRYVLVTQSSNKKVKCGICMKLLSPWTVSKVHLGEEVVHAVGGYQIVVPALLRMTDEILRGIVTSRAAPYNKFFKSIPSRNSKELHQIFPWLESSKRSLATVAATFSETVTIDVWVVFVFFLPDSVKVLLQDSDSAFGLLEIPNYYTRDKVREQQALQLVNLGFAGRVTKDTHCAFFSVMNSLGSPQESYIRLLWRPDSTAVELESQSGRSFPECPKVTLGVLSKSVKEESRVTVTGVVASIMQSKLVLEDGEKQIELLILPSFQLKNSASSEYLEKKVEIKFLRVKPNLIHIMDEYSEISLLPCVVPCGSMETPFMED